MCKGIPFTVGISSGNWTRTARSAGKRLIHWASPALKRKWLCDQEGGNTQTWVLLPSNFFVSMQLAIYLPRPPSLARKDSKPEMADVRGDIRAWILGKSLCKTICSAPCLQHLFKNRIWCYKDHTFWIKTILCILKWHYKEICCCNECHCNEDWLHNGTPFTVGKTSASSWTRTRDC